jgi:lambda repressor-like predicted transcriptional regulator
MNSTVGRPRAVTDAQVAAVLEWHRARKSLKQVARENNLSPSTVRNIIQRNGQYKQPSPELRAIALARRRRRLGDLEARHLM